MTAPPLDGLRRALPADAPAIAALVRGAYGKYIPRIGREPKPMSADYGAAVVRHELWLLESEGALVAVLELIPAPDHLLIENIAVEPSRQGRGLGRALLAFAETEARRQGHGELRLYTNERFTENLALYARVGYRETHREPYGGSTVVHLAKRIA